VRRFYIREAPGLPTIKSQKVALGLEAVADDDPVYVDLNPKRRRATPAEPFPELAEAIRSLRAEDELAVAGPEILGGSQAQIFQVMQAIGAKQAAIYDASTDQVIAWQPEALKALDFAARGETKRREFALRKARVRRAELGRGNGRVAQLDKDKNPKAYKVALAVWLDPELTGNQAADKIGVSPSTAYRKLGPRDQPIFGRKTSK
jgi:hypothetical protein